MRWESLLRDYYFGLIFRIVISLFPKEESLRQQSKTATVGQDSLLPEASDGIAAMEMPSQRPH